MQRIRYVFFSRASQFAVHTQLIGLAFHHGRFRQDALFLLRSFERHVERQPSFLASLQPYDGQLVGKRGERLALVVDTPALIQRACYGIGEAQRTTVAGGRQMRCGEGQNQVAHRLVDHAMARHRAIGRDAVHSQILRPLVVATVDGRPDFGQCLQCLRVRIVIGRPAPERILVQLDGITLQTAVDHSPQTAVTQWQRLDPMGGRTVVPQRLCEKGLCPSCEEHSRHERNTAYYHYRLINFVVL